MRTVVTELYGMDGGPVGARSPPIVNSDLARPSLTATYHVQDLPSVPGLGDGSAVQHQAAGSPAASSGKASLPGVNPGAGPPMFALRTSPSVVLSAVTVLPSKAALQIDIAEAPDVESLDALLADGDDPHAANAPTVAMATKPVTRLEMVTVFGCETTPFGSPPIGPWTHRHTDMGGRLSPIPFSRAGARGRASAGSGCLQSRWAAEFGRPRVKLMTVSAASLGHQCAAWRRTPSCASASRQHAIGAGTVTATATTPT